MNSILSVSFSRIPEWARRFILSGILLLSFSTCARSSYAKPDFPPYVRIAAGVKANGVLDKASASCTLCHAPAPPKMNPFGADLKTALHLASAAKLTPAIFQSIDAHDSDGDGFSNAAEFKADTLPGDSSNKPSGKPSISPVMPSTNGVAERPGPFSPRTLFFPDHAQHPVIVHFPIALFLMSLVFDLLGHRKQQEGLLQAAYFNLIAAAVSSPLAVMSGILIWQFRLRAAPLEGFLRIHFLLGITTTLLLFTLWRIRALRNQNPSPRYKRLYVIMSILTLAVLSLTGHLGGTMVFGE